MVKILHTADLHLGYAQYGYESRREDFLNTLDYIGDLAISHGVSAVVISGDTFDQKHPHGRVVLRLKKFVDKLRDNNIDVITIVGNHDNVPEWFELVGSTNLGNGDTVKVGDFTIMGMGYLLPKDFMEELGRMVLDADSNKADVLLVHQAFKELAGFSGCPLSIEETAPMVAALGVRYVAMGDIHQGGSITMDGVEFNYPGSPECKTKEEGNDKTVNIIELHEDGGHTVTKVSSNPRTVMDLHIDNDKEVLELLSSDEFKELIKTKLPVVHITHGAGLTRGAKELQEKIMELGGIARTYVTHSDDVAAGSGVNLSSSELEGGETYEILRGAITVYFDDSSDESQLITQLLEGMDIVEVVNSYMEGYENENKETKAG